MRKHSTQIPVALTRKSSRQHLLVLLVTGALIFLFLYMASVCLSFPAESSGIPDFFIDAAVANSENPISSGSVPTIDTIASAPEEDVYYFYSQLPSADQERYRKILTCLQNHDEQLILQNTSADRLEAVFLCVTADHPELFWVDSGFSYDSLPDSITLHPNYNRTAAEVQAIQPLLNNAVQTAVSTIGPCGSEYETVKAAYEYIVQTVDYAFSDDDQNIISALIDHTSVCAGYSRALQFLLQQYGIQSIFVTGEILDAGSHAWLVTQVDGNYYNVDVTYADLNAENSIVPDSIACDYLYLCASDDLLYRDHLQAPSYLPIPSCTEEDLEYYRRNDLYFSSYDDALDSMEQSLRRGETFWTAQFDTPELFRQFYDAVQNDLYPSLAVPLGFSASGSFWNLKNDIAYTVTCWYTT